VCTNAVARGDLIVAFLLLACWLLLLLLLLLLPLRPRAFCRPPPPPLLLQTLDTNPPTPTARPPACLPIRSLPTRCREGGGEEVERAPLR